MQKVPLLVVSVIGLAWLVVVLLSLRSSSVSACVPSNSDALWPYWRNNRARFDELKQNQCAIWQNDKFVDRYCFGSKINACVNVCSSDTQCLIERDVTNLDAKTTYVQQACLIKENDSKNAADILRYVPVDAGNFQTRIAPVSLYCQCRVNGECRNNEECIQGVCQCRNSAQCGIGRQCLWYGRNWNELGRDSSRKEYYTLGQCACDKSKGREGCNGRGHCTQPENFRTCSTCINQVGFRVPGGDQGDGAAKCQCLNGFTGEFCGIDAAVQTMCSGNGTPLCLAVNAKDSSKRAVSLNTGAEIISNLGVPLFQCDVNTLKFPPESSPNRRGDYGCQCYPGWGPEIASPGVPKCSQKIDCQTLAGNGKLVGFVAGNGKCKCINDYYDR
jgi:hypothetical protein